MSEEQYSAYCPLCGAVIIIKNNKPTDKHCPCCGHHLAYYQEIKVN